MNAPLLTAPTAVAPSDALDELVTALSRWRLPVTPETALQDGIEVALTEIQRPFRREALLTVSDRIDFLVGSLGLEVKVDGGLAEVTRQLHRYSLSASVTGLLLVTTRARHMDLPTTLNGKPLRSLHVTRGAF